MTNMQNVKVLLTLKKRLKQDAYVSTLMFEAQEPKQIKPVFDIEGY